MGVELATTVTGGNQVELSAITAVNSLTRKLPSMLI